MPVTDILLSAMGLLMPVTDILLLVMGAIDASYWYSVIGNGH